jgi:hypothetical protein
MSPNGKRCEIDYGAPPEVESVTNPDGIADDIGRESVLFVRVRCLIQSNSQSYLGATCQYSSVSTLLSVLSCQYSPAFFRGEALHLMPF